MKSCPTCGRPFPPELRVSGPVRQRIVEIVSRRPDGITKRDLVDLVYADDPNGGPENASTISVIMMHANRQLRPQGYEIKSSGGPGARYSLVRS